MKAKIAFLFLIMMCNSVYGQSALIRELAGNVELRFAGAIDFVPARVGETVAENTVISTSFRSMALLEIGNKLIHVRPLTRLTLTEISAAHGMETLYIHLQAGRVRVDLNHPPGTRASMQVQSSIANASVRGTSFEFDTRNLSVDDGVVYFKGNRGYSFQINTGFSASVDRKNTVAPSLPNETGARSQALVGYDATARPVGVPGPSSESEPGREVNPGPGPGQGPVDPGPGPGPEPERPGTGGFDWQW
jgi:hypothetical protein